MKFSIVYIYDPDEGIDVDFDVAITKLMKQNGFKWIGQGADTAPPFKRDIQFETEGE